MGSVFHYTKLPIVIEHILPEMSLDTNNLKFTNDPRESQLWAVGSINLPLEKVFPDYYSDKTQIECQFKFGKLIKNRLQVLCFSGANHDGWNNEMMWAHYCHNHAGVCMEFDEQALKHEVQHQCNNSHYFFENVCYEKGRDKPWFNWNDSLGCDQNLDNYIIQSHKEIAFRKSLVWEQEDEKRLVVLNDEQVKLPIKSSLKAIYFGLNFLYQYLPAIESLLNGLEVKLYDVIYQNYKYERWLRNIGSKKIPISRKFDSLR